jgi:hypothetical protein
MSRENAFDWLQSFFQSCCDGSWEHDYGCTMESGSAPGWRMTFDLNGTPYEGALLDELEDHLGPISWMRCKIEGGRYIADCSPKRLAECIEILRDVVEGRRGEVRPWANRDT